MANTEEKVQSFLSDEKKVEAIASDDAFMKKMSEGTATPEDIVAKFNSVGLLLTENEAKLVGDTTTTILTKTPVAKLGQRSLDTVSGGQDWMKVASTAGFAAGVAGAAGVLACGVAKMVCNYKAKNAAIAGNIKLSHDYTDHATALGKVSKACAGVGAVGIGIGVGFGITDHLSHSANNNMSGNFSFKESHDNPLYEPDDEHGGTNPLFEGNI